MIKFKAVSKTRNTIQEVIDQSAVNIFACRAAKDEDRAANRAIHAAGGEDRMWQEIANGATTVGLWITTAGSIQCGQAYAGSGSGRASTANSRKC